MDIAGLRQLNLNTMARISTKRTYDQRSASDGLRVLVDRIWPRVLTKEKAAVDHWAKDIAPSTELRNWFAHDPARSDAFQERYKAELANKTDGLRAILDMGVSCPITLLFSAREPSTTRQWCCRMC